MVHLSGKSKPRNLHLRVHATGAAFSTCATTRPISTYVGLIFLVGMSLNFQENPSGILLQIACRSTILVPPGKQYENVCVRCKREVFTRATRTNAGSALTFSAVLTSLRPRPCQGNPCLLSRSSRSDLDFRDIITFLRIRFNF